LKPEDQDAILQDFPKPDFQALQVPKLNDQVKDHLKKKSINPHFGAEKSLYCIHSQVLVLWSDLLDTGVTIKGEQSSFWSSRLLFCWAASQIDHTEEEVDMLVMSSRISPLRMWKPNFFQRRIHGESK